MRCTISCWLWAGWVTWNRVRSFGVEVKLHVFLDGDRGGLHVPASLLWGKELPGGRCVGGWLCLKDGLCTKTVKVKNMPVWYSNFGHPARILSFCWGSSSRVESGVFVSYRLFCVSDTFKWAVVGELGRYLGTGFDVSRGSRMSDQEFELLQHALSLSFSRPFSLSRRKCWTKTWPEILNSSVTCALEILFPSYPRDLPLLQNDQTGCWAHPTLYLVVTGVFAPGVNQPGRETDT